MPVYFTTCKIIVQASTASADALIQSCANIRTMTKDIYAPAIGESVQIGQQTNSFSISISDELLSSIRMSRVCWYSQCSMLVVLMIRTNNSSRTTKSDSSQAASSHTLALRSRCWNPHPPLQDLQYNPQHNQKNPEYSVPDLASLYPILQ